MEELNLSQPNDRLARERQRKRRTAESSDESTHRKLSDKMRKASQRAIETPAQRESRLAKQRERIARQ